MFFSSKHPTEISKEVEERTQSCRAVSTALEPKGRPVVQNSEHSAFLFAMNTLPAVLHLAASPQS